MNSDLPGRRSIGEGGTAEAEGTSASPRFDRNCPTATLFPGGQQEPPSRKGEDAMFPTMDEQVAKNLKLTYRLFKVVGHTPEGRPLEEDLGSVGNGWASNLEDGGRYRLSIAVQNTGIELFFRQTQIRVAPSLRNDIPTSEIYVDSHFETQTNRGDSPCDSGLLGPESSYPGGGLSVYFKRTIPLDENHGVVRCFDIGVYAEVVPQGNCWHVLRL